MDEARKQNKPILFHFLMSNTVWLLTNARHVYFQQIVSVQDVFELACKTRQNHYPFSADFD